MQCSIIFAVSHSCSIFFFVILHSLFPFASCLQSVMLLPTPSLSLYLSLIIAIIFSLTPSTPFLFSPGSPFIRSESASPFPLIISRFALLLRPSAHLIASYLSTSHVFPHTAIDLSSVCCCSRHPFLCSESAWGLVIHGWDGGSVRELIDGEKETNV